MEDKDIMELDIKEKEKEGLLILKHNARQISSFVVDKDYDWFHLVIGREGVGKSSFAVLFAKLLDPSFGVDRVIFTYEDFKKAVITAKPGQVVLVDEGGLLFFCLDKNTKVKTNKGIKKLRDLNGKEKLLSYNFDKKTTKFVNYKKYNRPVSKIYKIEIGSDKINCSGNHKWFVKVNNKIIEKRTADLNIGDLLSFENNKYKIIKNITSIEKDDEFIDIETPTENFILENGIISHNSRNAMKGQQKEIVQLLTIMRQRNLIVIICIPSINIVESYIKEHRIRSLTVIKARGLAYGYGQNKVIRMIALMKKTKGKGMNLIPPGFKIRVPDVKKVYPEFWQFYRKKKDDMIVGKHLVMEDLLKGIKNKEEVLGADSVFNRNISYICKRYGLSRTSFRRLREAHPEIGKRDVMGRFKISEKAFEKIYYPEDNNNDLDNSKTKS